MSDRLEQRRAARDRQIQEEIDNPDTSQARRLQLLQLQRRRNREGRSSNSSMNVPDIDRLRSLFSRSRISPGIAPIHQESLAPRINSRSLASRINSRALAPRINITGTSEELSLSFVNIEEIQLNNLIEVLQEYVAGIQTNIPESNLQIDVVERTNTGATINLTNLREGQVNEIQEILRRRANGPVRTEEANGPVRTEEDNASTLEEDSDQYSSIQTNTSALSDEYISESDSDESCKSDQVPMTKEREWMARNCNVCKSMVTLDDFEDEDYPDIVSIKTFDVNTSKFSKGHCIPKSDIIGMLRSDIGSEYPQYVFSLYKKKPETTNERSLGGLGTSPTNQFVVQFNIGALSIFVTLGSIYKMLHGSEKMLYAAPLYGGKRRRLGNIPGRMSVVGANHGQIPGFLIYKLFTRDEIEAGVEVSAGETDFIIPMTISKKVEELVDVFSNNNRIYQLVLDEIIKYITSQP